MWTDHITKSGKKFKVSTAGAVAQELIAINFLFCLYQYG